MTNYLGSTQEFCARSAFNEQKAAELEDKRPGHLQQLCASASAYVDSRLRKRVANRLPYAIPFVEPPEQVLRWVADLVTPRAFESLGVSPSDEIQERILKREEKAEEELAEAADSQNNKFDLPLSDSNGTSAFDVPQTLCSSEQSPFSWRHRQYDAVRGDRRYG